MKHRAPEPEEKKDGRIFFFRNRRFLKIVYTACIAVVALLLLLLICRDFLIRRSVTVIGSRVLGVPVTLDEVETSLWKGTVSLSNLKIANPKGYDDPYLLQLEYFFTDVDLATLFGKALSIDVIRISGLHAQGALGENGKLNLSVINEYVQRKFPPAQEPEESAEHGSGKNSGGKSLIIRSFVIENSSASLREDHTDFQLKVPLDCEKEDIVIANDDRTFPEKLNDFTNLVQAWSNGALHASGALVDTGKSIINQGTGAGKAFATPVLDFLKKTFSDAKK